MHTHTQKNKNKLVFSFFFMFFLLFSCFFAYDSFLCFAYYLGTGVQKCYGSNIVP